MPSLPALDTQVVLGLNKYCRLCNLPVDRRSRTCRRCHAIILAMHRFPRYRRPDLTCRDCGNPISYRSACGQGRCRCCHFQHLRDNVKPKRSARRDAAGTSYQDVDGNARYADEELDGFTVASAWGSLRRCWKAIRITQNNGDKETEYKYLCRIRHLQKILNLEATIY